MIPWMVDSVLYLFFYRKYMTPLTLHCIFNWKQTYLHVGFILMISYLQVLFVYRPEKELPLKYKDLLSFCFPGAVEVYILSSGIIFTIISDLCYSKSFSFS